MGYGIKGKRYGLRDQRRGMHWSRLLSMGVVTTAFLDDWWVLDRGGMEGEQVVCVWSGSGLRGSSGREEHVGLTVLSSEAASENDLFLISLAVYDVTVGGFSLLGR